MNIKQLSNIELAGVIAEEYRSINDNPVWIELLGRLLSIEKFVIGLSEIVTEEEGISAGDLAEFLDRFEKEVL